MAKEVRIQDAPLEWLIAHTLINKYHQNEMHGKHLSFQAPDQLVDYIFRTVDYDYSNDELILSSSKSTQRLRHVLIKYLSNTHQKRSIRQKIDPKYLKWKKERSSLYDVTLSRVRLKNTGHYLFNHVHTNLSRDNADLRLLKISPKKTFKIIDQFLKKKKSTRGCQLLRSRPG